MDPDKFYALKWFKGDLCICIFKWNLCLDFFLSLGNLRFLVLYLGQILHVGLNFL